MNNVPTFVNELQVLSNGKYLSISTFTQMNEDLEILLFNLLDGTDEDVIPLRDALGHVIDVENVFIEPYSTTDEVTGEESEGALTFLFTKDKRYVTSSKTIYHTIVRALRLMNISKMKFEVVKVKSNQGNDQFKLKLIK